MRKTLFAVGFLAASSLMASGGPAAAQGFGQVPIAAAPPEAPAATAPTPAKPGGAVSGVTVAGKKTADSQKDPNEVICHSETPMGTRFPVKTCARRGELAARAADDQAATRQMTSIRPGVSN